MNNERNASALWNVVCIGIIATIFTQSNNSAISTISEYFMYGAWAIALLYVSTKGTIFADKTFYAMLFGFIFMFCQGKLLYLLGTYTSSGAGPGKYLLYCSLFYLLGLNCVSIDEDRVISTYFIFGVIFTASRYFYLIGGANDAGKNQAGQVIGLTIILIICTLSHSKSSLSKKLKLVAAVCCYITLWILHCRTSLLAVTVVLAIIWIRRKKQPFEYICAGMFICAVAFYLFFTASGKLELYNLLQGDLSVSTLTIDSVSSGRVSLYKETIELIKERPFWGFGGWAYMDCFPLHVLWTGGIVSAIILFPIAYGTLIKGFKWESLVRKAEFCDEEANYSSGIFASICVFYFIVSLFEGYPPFGPGTSSFFLWLYYGYVRNKMRPYNL